MKLNITLSKSDYLVHQLFIASRSKLVKKKRTLSRMAIPIIYLMAGGYFYYIDKIRIAGIFSLVGIIWFLFYPYYSRRRYKKQFEKLVDEKYRSRMNQENELTIARDVIKVKDEVSESKISVNEVSELIELKDHFLIQVKSGFSIIIPKRSIADEEYFTRKFKKMNIQHYNEKGWEWK